MEIYEKPCLSAELNRAIFDIIAKNKTPDKKAQSSTETAASPPVATKPLTKLKILAADDDLINREVLKQLLADQDFDLTCVESGHKAVEKFNQETFDVVLMDISMPDMDGPMTTAAIRKLEKQNACVPTPIIATTANTVGHDKNDYLEAGMNDFLTKPLDKRRLF